MPPIKVFCVGASLIKNHTHKGPKAVSSKKKIPTSGELMNCGAILINTKDNKTKYVFVYIYMYLFVCFFYHYMFLPFEVILLLLLLLSCAWARWGKP